MLCKLCEKPIADPKKAWREQVGWVSPKGAKGMTLAHQTGELAHAECITLGRAHVSALQEKLV